MSTADYQRRWRASKGARTGAPGRPPAPCGTRAAYHRHLRNGEPTCEPCRQANREHVKSLRAARGI